MNVTFDVVRVGDKYQLEKTEGGKRFALYRDGSPLKAEFRGDLDAAVKMLEASNGRSFLNSTWVSQATVYQGGKHFPNMFMAKAGRSVPKHVWTHRIGAFNGL